MANLFWTHPNGDSVMLPCTHPVVAHPAGHPGVVPCIHPRVQAHPGGDTVRVGPTSRTVPCIHWVSPHPGGDAVTTPCPHVGLLHPGGDPGPAGPCLHPLTPVDAAPADGLLFFTDDASLQRFARDAVALLRKLDVNPVAPRPLSIFSRAPLNGTPVRSDDPFWSHYEPDTHAIQIAPEHAATAAVLNHELGHAILGHRCVRIASAGGAHGATDSLDPGTAMSEGWADFVAAVLTNTLLTQRGRAQVHATFGTPLLAGLDLETRPAAIVPDPAVEYCVAATLWDLYDTQQEPGPDPDTERFTFAQLYGVFAVTPSTIPQGPVIQHVDDYLERLKLQFPNRADRIDAIKRRNLGL